MHSLTIFDSSAADDEATVSLRELLDFMEKPQSIGLDNLKKSLRDIVLLALEIKGYDTGMSLQHLTHGGHSSLAPDGISKIDKARKRRIQQFWDDINEIEREMARSFNIIFDFAVEKIVEIKQDIIQEIAVIDTRIEEEAATQEEAKKLIAASKKRKKLVKFKNHVKAQEAQLQEARTTKEVINIQNSVIEDVQDFKNGNFPPSKPRPNRLEALWGLFGAGKATNDDKYDSKTEPNSALPKEDKDTISETDTDSDTGSSDTDDDSSGEKQGETEDEQQKPPTFEVSL